MQPWFGGRLLVSRAGNVFNDAGEMADEKMQEYRTEWSDEQVMEWDGNFKDDGALMLICSERDIDVEEYRQELEGSRAYRERVRNS